MLWKNFCRKKFNGRARKARTQEQTVSPSRRVRACTGGHAGLDFVTAKLMRACRIVKPEVWSAAERSSGRSEDSGRNFITDLS